MAKYWYQENLRFLQTVLRGIDIIDYDAAGVADYMKKVNANTLVVNAGGVIDFFKHDMDMANLNRFYQKDMLQDVCREIHQAGLRVICRVDFRGPEPRRYNLHPDWFAVDQEGNPRAESRYKSANIFKPCYNSPYTSAHAVEFIEYLLSHYELDGIWENSLGFDNAPCYCKRCRDLYRKEMGKEIPPLPGGPGNLSALDTPAFTEYRAWKARHADEHIERLRKAVKKYGEDKAYCAEIFDLYSDSFTRNTGIDHYNAKKSSGLYHHVY